MANSPSGEDELEILPAESAQREPVELEIVRESPSGREAYNMVSDTVTGVNVRLSDNLFQAVAIAVFIAIGAAVGALLGMIYGRESIDIAMGAAAGGFAGMILGLFISGFCLMIYRARKHAKGDHK